MPQSIKNRLESMFSKTQSTLKGDDSILEVIEPKFDKLMSGFNSEAITYCIEKYIEAELDYTTPGSRGIGRTVSIIPRLGSYFRKPLSKLSNKELNKLHCFIQDLCLRGYLDSVLYIEWPAKSDKLSNKEVLFEEWIPFIYTLNPYELDLTITGVGAWIWDLIKADTLFTLVEIHNFMRENEVVSDALFKKIERKLSGDKINLILDYYTIAGFSLRAIEEGYY